MAIAFDAASETGFNSVSSVSWSHTSAGEFLCATIGCLDTGTRASVTAFTYNGVSLTAPTISRAEGTNHFTEQWYIADSASGANTVAITLDQSISHSGNAGAISLTGADLTSPEGDSDGTYVGGSTTISRTITGVSTGSWGVAAIHTQDDSPSSNSGQTRRWDRTQGGDTWQAQDTEPEAGSSMTMGFSVGANNRMAMLILEVKEASAAAASLIHRPYPLRGLIGR